MSDVKLFYPKKNIFMQKKLTLQDIQLQSFVTGIVTNPQIVTNPDTTVTATASFYTNDDQTCVVAPSCALDTCPTFIEYATCNGDTCIGWTCGGATCAYGNGCDTQSQTRCSPCDTGPGDTKCPTNATCPGLNTCGGNTCAGTCQGTCCNTCGNTCINTCQNTCDPRACPTSNTVGGATCGATCLNTCGGASCLIICPSGRGNTCGDSCVIRCVATNDGSYTCGDSCVIKCVATNDGSYTCVGTCGGGSCLVICPSGKGYTCGDSCVIKCVGGGTVWPEC